MSSFLFASGALAAEAALLEAVREQVAAARQEPRLLRQPVLVVVPSRELRDHLAIRLAEAGATLGVEVLSLHALALRLWRETGTQPEARSALVELLARRAAAEQPALQAQLAPLQDGMALAATSIRDLLSARALDGDFPIVRAARATAQAMAEHQIARPGDLQEGAAALVDAHLQARAVLVHGFADATGQALALLRSLREAGARFVIDLPRDPAAPQRRDRGVAVAADFVRALGGTLPAEETEPPPPAAAHWDQYHAAGAEDEVRELAHRLRALLEAGVPAERIGVVARRLAPYAVPVRRFFAEFAVPWRGDLAPATLFPLHRRMRAALAVLREAEDCPVDRWLDALVHSRRGGPGWSAEEVTDLRLAFRVLGLARLGQLRHFDETAAVGERDFFPLPVRRGLVEATIPVEEDDAETDEPLEAEILPFEKRYRASRRAIPRRVMRAAFSAARALLRDLPPPQQTGPLEDHAEAVARLLRTHFGWRSDGLEECEDWPALLRELGERDIGPCTRAEFLVLFEGQTRRFGAWPLGGRSGVAVLELTQARARTFDHLFVLGMNRGVFPRPIHADPLLPDGVRAVLRKEHGAAALQLAERGHGEERYLFAQLCSAAPRLTLSWQRADEDGKELASSAYLHRLWLSEDCPLQEIDAEAVPRLREQLLALPERPRTAAEALTLAGLRGHRDAWAALLPAALEEAQERVHGSATASADLARARAQILAEYEPALHTAAGRARQARLSPWSGVLPQSLADGSAVAVTRLESFAACGWRSFLEHHLHLEPTPDPLAALPDLDAALLGSTVHLALERLLGGEAEARSGLRRVPRPAPASVAEAVQVAAREIAVGDELRVPGLIAALAQRARPFVERALELEFSGRDALRVEACEKREEIPVPLPDGGQRTLSFLADRLDRDADGQPVYIDYKTAAPFSKAKKAETRAAHLVDGVLQARRLQVAAYAAAAPGARGEYLFLREFAGSSEAHYRVGLQHDSPWVTAFRETAGRLLAAREDGLAFPRMERPAPNRGPGPACAWCELADACLRQDSGARRRLVDGIASRTEAGLDWLWALPSRKQKTFAAEAENQQ